MSTNKAVKGPGRRFLRRFLWLGGLAIAVGLAGAAYYFRPLPVGPAPELKTLNASADDGAYLAQIGNCSACHTRPGGTPFAGGVKFATPFGTLFSTNITPDRVNGIGAWSFADFHGAMKHGLSPDGGHLYPAFPYDSFAKLSDRDIGSLYKYLGTLKPARENNRANQLDFPFGNRDLLHFWKRMFHDSSSLANQDDRSAQWNRGAYLVEAVAHCGACHTPRNMLGATDRGRALQGGVVADRVLTGAYRNWAASDITPGPRGLAGWSANDIVKYLKAGKNAHAIVHGPMTDVYESTKHLSDADAGAIAEYLKSVEPGPGPGLLSMLPKDTDEGKIVYTVHCGTCHLPDGKGDRLLGVSLANNAIVQAPDPASLINVILYGPQLPPPPFTSDRTKMKPFGKRLSDEDIAHLATFLRANFGNSASKVSPDQVRDQR